MISPFITLGKINRPQEGVYVGSLWNQQLLQTAGLDRGHGRNIEEEFEWALDKDINILYA